MRQAITSCIRNINGGCTCFDHGFNYPGEIIIVGTASILCVKLNIVNKISGPFHALNSSLQNFFPGRIKFSLYMKVRSADACVNTRISCKLQCFGGNLNILLYRTAQTANLRIFNDRSYLFYAFKIPGA